MALHGATTPWGQQTLFTMAYGNGIFVAVGDGGTILTSPDAIDWTSRTSGTAEDIWGLTFANSIFVAASGFGTTILTSLDGVTWTSRPSGATYGLKGIAYGNGIFVGAGGNILTSPDGVTWTRRTPGANGVAYGKGTFVAVGSSSNNLMRGTVLTSPDEVTWTDRTPGTINALNSITYANDIFVAVGNSTILTSHDAVTWTSWAPGAVAGLAGIAYANGVFVAVGHGGVILTSHTIATTVRDSATGNPVAAATVTIKDMGNNVVSSGMTGENGQFSASIFSAGMYNVNASKGFWLSVSPNQLVSVSDIYNPATTMYLATGEAATVSIPLSQGWNFITTQAQPSDTRPDAVFSAIVSNVAIVWGWNELTQNWSMYVPSASDNTLTSVESGRGYWVYMNTASTLLINGTAGPSTVHLSDGWNLVGFNGQDNKDTSASLQPINGKWWVIWTWDVEQWYAKHATISSAAVPLLSNLNQKKAYWIMIKPGMATDWTQ